MDNKPHNHFNFTIGTVTYTGTWLPAVEALRWAPKAGTALLSATNRQNDGDAMFDLVKELLTKTVIVANDKNGDSLKLDSLIQFNIWFSTRTHDILQFANDIVASNLTPFLPVISPASK